MEKDKYISLVYKNLKAEISPGEQAELDAWLAGSAENRRLAEGVTSDWEASQNYAPKIEIDAAGDFEKLRRRVQSHKAREEKAPAKIVPMKPRRQWVKWVAAAAAFAIFSLGGNWFADKIFGPGTEWIVLKTGPGESQNITLPDGSEVWLNEKTIFEYPVEFTDNQRVVKLSGEAYFDVFKNKAVKFRVEMALATVTVLGTEFNLNTYPDSQSVVLTVDEGRVRIQPKGSPQSAVANAGEQVVFDDRAGRMALQPILDENAAFWKNKTLVFTERRLSDVLVSIRRELGTEVELAEEYMKFCRLTGRFPNATAREMLEHIADSFGMELVEISEGKYVMRGGDCN